jgi:hypothetical protein
MLDLIWRIAAPVPRISNCGRSLEARSRRAAGVVLEVAVGRPPSRRHAFVWPTSTLSSFGSCEVTRQYPHFFDSRDEWLLGLRVVCRRCCCLLNRGKSTNMEMAASPTIERLEDQIGWYDNKSGRAQKWFKTLKIVQLVTAGAIPLIAVLNVPFTQETAAVLGLVILVVEGLQQLNQYQANWINYRSTCESLRHEEYLFLGGAGPMPRSINRSLSWLIELRVSFRRSTRSGFQHRNQMRNRTGRRESTLTRLPEVYRPPVEIQARRAALRKYTDQR